MEDSTGTPPDGFRRIFTRPDVRAHGEDAVLDTEDAVAWARAHGYRLREVMFGTTKAYELSSMDGGGPPPLPR